MATYSSATSQYIRKFTGGPVTVPTNASTPLVIYTLPSNFLGFAFLTDLKCNQNSSFFLVGKNLFNSTASGAREYGYELVPGIHGQQSNVPFQNPQPNLFAGSPLVLEDGSDIANISTTAYEDYNVRYLTANDRVALGRTTAGSAVPNFHYEFTLQVVEPGSPSLL